MLSLVVTILFALAIAYFAIQNTMGVPLVIANNIFTDVPLFTIVIGSVLLGVLMSSVISGLNSLTSYLTLRNREHVIKEDAKAIRDLQEKVQGLEAENAKLRTEELPVSNQTVASSETLDESVGEPAPRHSFFHNVFHSHNRTV